MSEILSVTGNISVLVDLMGASHDSLLDGAKKSDKTNYVSFIKSIFTQKAEIGLKISGQATFKLSELTVKFFPNLSVGNVGFSMLATVGGDKTNSKAQKGIYIRGSLRLTFISDFYNNFKKTIGKVLEFLAGVQMPDLSLDIDVDLGISIQEEYVGVMLQGTFFGRESTPIICIFRNSDNNLSCSGLNTVFNVMVDGINWVIHRASDFFKKVGDSIKGALNKAGEWITSQVIEPIDRFFKGQCRCNNGMEESALLCYNPCKEGFYGVMNRCIPYCPSNFRNDGDYCFKPQAYGRGVGYFLWDLEKCSRQNPQGCEQWGLVIYPKCDPLYYNVACCICSPRCPNDMEDIGISCHKSQIYNRGVGLPLDCSAPRMIQPNAGDDQLNDLVKKQKAQYDDLLEKIIKADSAFDKNQKDDLIKFVEDEDKNLKVIQDKHNEEIKKEKRYY